MFDVDNLEKRIEKLEEAILDTAIKNLMNTRLISVNGLIGNTVMKINIMKFVLI